MKFNGTESEITGRTPKDVIGRNLFKDVAPCTQGHLFQGKVLSGVAEGEVNAMFEYTFDYKMAPAKVRVHMKSNSIKDGIWIFVKRM